MNGPLFIVYIIKLIFKVPIELWSLTIGYNNMGCLNSRNPLDNTEEESKIEIFENSLMFRKLNVFDVDRTFHRFSTNGIMSNSQMSRAFDQLNLPLSKFDTFYNKFLNNGSFNMRRLICLGILLCNSGHEDKLKVLFQCYDDDLSDTLSPSELKVMFEDLTIISCEFIPSYALSLFSNESNLYNYNKHVNELRKSIASQICNFLTEDKKMIKFSDLLKSYLEDEGTGSILNSGKMRTYCIKIRSTIINTAECAIKILDTQEDFEELGFQEVEVHTRRKNKRRTGNGNESVLR